MNRLTVGTACLLMKPIQRLAGRCVALAAGGFLVACGGDTFTSFERIATDADPGEAATDGDARTLEDGGGSDAAVTDAPTDSASDAYVCPTGVQACLDAIALLCSRQKGCGSQTCDDMNTSTASCNGKTICEKACLMDIQNASCTWINQHSVSPGFVSGNCAALMP
jgi:hypothetical protein